MNNALMEIGKRLVVRLSIDEREKHEAYGIILSALEEAAKQGVQATGLCTCKNTVAVNHINGTCVGCGKPPRA